MLVIRFKRIAAMPISIIIIIGIGKGRMEIDGERRGTTTITTTIIIISGEEGRVEDRFLFDVFVLEMHEFVKWKRMGRKEWMSIVDCRIFSILKHDTRLK